MQGLHYSRSGDSKSPASITVALNNFNKITEQSCDNKRGGLPETVLWQCLKHKLRLIPKGRGSEKRKYDESPVFTLQLPQIL